MLSGRISNWSPPTAKNHLLAPAGAVADDSRWLPSVSLHSGSLAE